ncbi:MAG: bacteriohemerythrin [Thermodesulfobacteriota bacterium]
MSLDNQKSLNFKFSVLLMFVLGFVFVLLTFAFNHIHVSEVKALASGTGSIDTDQSFSVLKQVFFLTFLCFLFSAAVLARFFIFSVSRPLKQLSQSLGNLVAKDTRDLTFRLNYKRTDEIGILAGSFDKFISDFDELIKTIGGETEIISAVSFEVSRASDEMAEESAGLYKKSNMVAAAAEKMDTSMHTVAAASEEASTNISSVADAAVHMQTNISNVAKNCDQAKEISGNAIESVDKASEKVSRLGEAASEIGEVTQVITEIAEKTNLLALNATIEAARAGEAGKGFAVVADEIKKLSSQTSQSTMTIHQKIVGIQNSTDETVDEVRNISRVITDVDKIVNDIVLSIEQQSETAAEVATNIEQASIGISEVNENVARSSEVASEISRDISDVDNVVSEMSSRAENMNRSAKDLDSLASNARDLMSAFMVTLKDSEKTSQKNTNTDKIPDLMPWTSKLETSIEEIDLQHKELVSFINQLYKGMRMHKGSQELGKILSGLADYTVMHFGTEEKLFEKYAYPKFSEHKKSHEDLVKKVVEFQKDFNSGKATVTMDLMDFLSDWLKNHILKTDMAYVPYIKEKMEKS